MALRVTRLFGAIFLVWSLLARAAASPIEDSIDFRPQAEAGSPTAETNSVADTADLSRASRAPDPGSKSRAGNPLWTVRLSDLSTTRDRPLFSASRRPVIAGVSVAAPLPQKQETPTPAPPERPLLTLFGTIVSRKTSVAVLQGSNGDAISRLRLGQENDGWRVQGISLRSIVVEKGAQSVKLDLPRPNLAPAQ
jgi:hypothetical protein